jgi:protein-arginine kinase
MDATQLKTPAFQPHEAALIKSTKISIARNFCDTDFTTCISKSDRERVHDMFEAISGGLTEDLAGKFHTIA